MEKRWKIVSRCAKSSDKDYEKENAKWQSISTGEMKTEQC